MTANWLGDRLAKVVLSLLVGGFAAWLALSQAPEADQAPNAAQPSDVAKLAKALEGDAISPYRWLELAEGYEQAGDVVRARACFRQAQELAPNLPPVWIRAAAFHFREGEKEQGLRAGAHAQAISDTSDAFLFQYYDRLVRNPSLVLRTLAGDRRSLTAWFRHTMSKGRVEDAAAAWKELNGENPAPRDYSDRAARAGADVDRRAKTKRELQVEYVGFLLEHHQYEAARKVWAGNGGSNGVYNGGFEREESGCRLDWKLTPLEAAEVTWDTAVAKEGKTCVRVSFRGTENTSFQHVSQAVVVTAGSYRFAVWMKTDGITTDQGVRLTIVDAEQPGRLRVETEMMRGTCEWTLLERNVAVPEQTHLVNVGIERRRSEKFENKIAGTVWVDAVSLTRVK